jgi:hypothetical protein
LKPENKKYLWLSLSFFLLLLSFGFEILANFKIYYNVDVVRQVGSIVYSYDIVTISNILFYIGSYAAQVFMLLGLYFLYSIYNEHTKSDLFLSAFLIFVLVICSHNSYYVYHITSLMLMALIALRYYRNYRQNRSNSTRLLAISFWILMFSHILFCFMGFNVLFYVAGELVQLAGYIILLVTFIRVLQDGKKKKPA